MNSHACISDHGRASPSLRDLLTAKEPLSALSRRLGVSYPHVYRLCQGESALAVDFAGRLFDATGVPVAELLEASRAAQRAYHARRLEQLAEPVNA